MVARNVLSLLVMAAAALIPSTYHAYGAVAGGPGNKIQYFWGEPDLAAMSLPVAAKHAPRMAMAASATVGPTMPENYYGIHVCHLAYGSIWPTMKVGTWRLWDAGVDWRQIQTSPTTYNWQTLDTYVALAQEKGVDLILELGVTPQWASSRPNEAAGYGPGAAAPPTSSTTWTNYVTAVAKRYKGKIAYYEIWNEANTITLWTGTPTQLVQLTALASKAIKSVDPAAKIISPSISNPNPPAVAFLNSLFQVGLGASIDAVGAHLYVLGQKPEAVLTGVNAIEAMLKQHNLTSKPIINTEFGWAAPTTFNSEDDQSGYLMRSFLVGWGAGLSRFMWYAWDNSNWVTLTMTTPDFKTPTVVAEAYATLEQWTVGNEVSRCAVLKGTVWSCNIVNPSGDHSAIYWDEAGPDELTPSLSWKPSKKVDMYGNVTAYTGGSLTITGHPVLVKE